MEIYSGYPVVSIRLEITLELAYLASAREIIVGIFSFLEGYDFGKVAK